MEVAATCPSKERLGRVLSAGRWSMAGFTCCAVGLETVNCHSEGAKGECERVGGGGVVLAPQSSRLLDKPTAAAGDKKTFFCRGAPFVSSCNAHKGQQPNSVSPGVTTAGALRIVG